MRMRILWLLPVMLAGCSSPEVPRTAVAARHAPPVDESRNMPLENRVSTALVDDHILDRLWLPGGTTAHYKTRSKEWDLILVKADSPSTAAIWLLDYKNELEGSKVVPSFGGFFGSDKGRPAFVFTKGAWFAAVMGLSEVDADAVARPFALRIH